MSEGRAARAGSGCLKALGIVLSPCLAGTLGAQTTGGGAGSFAAHVEVAVASRLVRVLDERNCVASELRPGDVRLLAGQRPLVSRLRRREGPLRVLVLVDASYSMVGHRLEMAEQSARRLLERLAREAHGAESAVAAVAAFDEQVYWLTPEGFTGELCEAAERVGEPQASGATGLWQALDQALSLVESEPSPWPTAIVVATDGQETEDRGGRLSERVERRSAALDIPIFAIAIPPIFDTLIKDQGKDGADDVRCRRAGWAPRWLDASRRRLLDVCTRSGGALYTPRGTEVREAVDFVYSQLHDVHEIEADIPSELVGGSFQLGVAATRPGLSVLWGRAPPPRRR